MDAISVDIDGPYEDEAALAVLLPWSFFHCFHFPRNAEQQYRTSVHFQGLTAEEKQQWNTTYLRFIQTITFASHGKRFLSKNPPNTARITTLLELFPEAKFIHIYRNPYVVYSSTNNMRNRVVETLTLQHPSHEDIEQQVIANYVQLMNSYFDQKKKIKKENLVEIQYEDLVTDPLPIVRRIYSELQLPDFEKALPELQKYLTKQSTYKTNVYALDKKIIEHIKKNWMFTIDRWKYLPPQ